MDPRQAAGWLALLAGLAGGAGYTVDLGRGTLELGGTELAGRRVDLTPGKNGAAAFSRASSRITFGPHRGLGVTSATSFTLELELRTTKAGFATAVMCREGGAVHYSLVIGREPGRLALELWTWSRERAMSARRLDDGRWHRVRAAYDAKSRTMALVVDGKVDALVPVTRAFKGSPRPALRLGDNLDPNVAQPFIGGLRAVRMRGGVPAAVTAALRRARALRVLDPGGVDAALEAWLHRVRRARPPHAATAVAWETQAATLRARVQDALGLWPPPYSGRRLAGARGPLAGGAGEATDFAMFTPQLPLALKRGGTIERDGYRLTRVYWQSFRGYWASGWLYVPASAVPARKRPAVLCPHGHFANGARHPVIQSRCITLARLGYVVLAVDSIHVYAPAIALTPVSVMTWNNLRALELLRGRADVDPRRIGVTGASGGGQQTYYLTALKTGLAAAAPAVMACHFDEILLSSGVHCACNFTTHLMRAADMPQMAATFAPKPQFFLSVTGDWTRRFPQRGYPEIRSIYDLYDAAERVGGQQWDRGHGYDRNMRNAMYVFFERWLHGVPHADPRIEPEQLATEPLAALNALDKKDVPRDVQPIVREFHERLEAPHKASRRRLADLFLASFVPVAGKKARRVRSFERDGRAVEAWAIRTTPEIELPALLLRPEQAANQVAVWVGDGGKAGLIERAAARIDAMLERGVAVLVVDVRYTGELDRARSWRGYYGRFTGRDPGIVAVHDLRHVTDALADLGLPERVILAGSGSHASTVVFAAALDPRVTGIALGELGKSYRDGRERPWIGRILLHGDLPGALELCRARGVRVTSLRR